MATKTKAPKAKASKGKEIKRGLKPRSSAAYDKEEFMHGESSVPQNDHTLNTNLCRIRLEYPRGKEGLTIFRPWPAPHPDAPEERFQRGRVGIQPREQGNWIFPVRAASFLGLSDGHCKKHTFLLYPPGANKEVKENNPLRVLFRAATKAHKEGEFATGGAWNAKWNKIVLGEEKKGADLSKPTTLWYMLGHIYANGEKDYLEERDKPLGLDADDELVVIRLSSGGGKQIMELFGKQKKEWEGDETKVPSLPYVFGDPIGSLQKDGSLKGGWIFQVWNPKQFRGFKPDRRTSWGGKVKEMQGFEIALEKEYKWDGDTYTPAMDPDEVKMIFEKYQFMMPSEEGANDGLLLFPTVEQQCLWIAEGFSSVPKMLQFGWADHPEFFTEEVRGVLKARVQAVVPGAEEEEDEDEDEPKPKKGKGKGKKTRKDPTQEVEDDEIEDDEEEVEEEESEEDEDLDEEPLGEEEEEEEDEEEESDDEPEEEEEEEESDDEEEDEEEESDDEPEEEEEEEESDDEEEEEESDDEEEEESDDEVPEEFRLDEEDEEESEEFDPDEEVDNNKKALKGKMNKSLKDAKGRSGKRTSAPAEAPAPPKKGKVKGKSAKAKPEAAAPAKSGKSKGKTPPKSPPKKVKGKK